MTRDLSVHLNMVDGWQKAYEENPVGAFTAKHTREFVAAIHVTCPQL